MLTCLCLKTREFSNVLNVKDHYWETWLHQYLFHAFQILDSLYIFQYFFIFKMEVIWLKQLKLTISRNIWNVTNNIETLLHHYWSLFTQDNTMWTVFTSSYLKHDLFNICLYFYVCGVYLLSSFFYILCWRGRYVEANSAEFDFILPLSLSWCNLCGRNRATGTHI